MTTRLPLGLFAIAAVTLSLSSRATPTNCAPAWGGSNVVNVESTAGWTIEHDMGASGTFQIVPGWIGHAVQMSWDLGPGSWIQARCDFPAPADLSRADLFGLTLHGDAAAPANNMSVMLADTAGVFYGYDIPGSTHGLNQVDRWLVNLPMPRKAFYRFWGPGQQAIDWSSINQLFVVVKRPAANAGGGAGRLTINQFQAVAAAQWPRQTGFVTVTTNSPAIRLAAANALGYLLSQTRPSGLVVSWKEEASPQAWLYDQALALIAFSRAGHWAAGVAANPAAVASDALAGFLMQAQKTDGHWARGWQADTAAEIVDDGWVGDQAWCVMALIEYSLQRGSPTARTVANRGAAWLTNRIEPSGAILGTTSTEGTVDVWWAMMATLRFEEAERIKNYLLDATNVWDADLRYWWRGANDPLIAMDTATWTSVFARHPMVHQSDRSLAALSFVRRTLATFSDDGSLCGLDGQGPVSIWNEGTAQYVAAGGEDADALLAMLLTQQHTDGSMPGSPDGWQTDAFGWLTPWSGVAPTAWLHFAITGLPFPPFDRDTDSDGAPDWCEYEAGTDPQDPTSVFTITRIEYDPIASTARLSWPTVTNRFYSLITTSSFSEPWSPVPQATRLPGTGMEIAVTLTNSPARFLRVVCGR